MIHRVHTRTRIRVHTHHKKPEQLHSNANAYISHHHQQQHWPRKARPPPQKKKKKKKRKKKKKGNWNNNINIVSRSCHGNFSVCPRITHHSPRGALAKRPKCIARCSTTCARHQRHTFCRALAQKVTVGSLVAGEGRPAHAAADAPGVPGRTC